MPKSRQEDGARAKRESNSKLSNNKYVKWGMSNKQKKRYEKNCICARPYNSYEYSLVINRREQQKKKITPEWKRKHQNIITYPFAFYRNCGNVTEEKR